MTTWYREIEVTDTLTKLGIAIEDLQEAVQAGESARATCTKNDPPGAPGYYSFARTTRRLRELLIPKNWKARDDKNLSTVVSPSGEIAIAVSTGDEGTGAYYRSVRTKYPKGEATKEILKANRQLCFAYVDASQNEERSDEATIRQTWLLLRRRLGSHLHWELSLPLELDDDEYVCTWEHRIILPKLTIDAPEILLDEEERAEPIVVKVERRD